MLTLIAVLWLHELRTGSLCIVRTRGRRWRVTLHLRILLHPLLVVHSLQTRVGLKLYMITLLFGCQNLFKIATLGREIKWKLLGRDQESWVWHTRLGIVPVSGRAVPLTLRIVEIRSSSAATSAFTSLAFSRRRIGRRKVALYLWECLISLISILLAGHASDHLHVRHLGRRRIDIHHSWAASSHIWRVCVWLGAPLK